MAAGSSGCRPPSDESAAKKDESAASLADALAPAPSVGLFRPRPEGVSLHWNHPRPLDIEVLAGPAPDQLRVVRALHAAGPTEWDLLGLAAGASHVVNCRFREPGASQWRTGPLGRVITGRSEGATYRVILLADTHQYHFPNRPEARENLRRTVAAVLAESPDFVVLMGDEAGIARQRYEEEPRTQEEASAFWAAWREEMSGLLAAVPSFLVLGNHEGEGGFERAAPRPSGIAHLQRWGTVARRQYFLNPLPHTYPEGAEDGGSDRTDSGDGSALQNYFAWSWGDALFVVIDVHRYTRIDQAPPTEPDHWSLGEAQWAWLERVLASSNKRWKLVLAHHVLGGYRWGVRGDEERPAYAYGRGGARYATVGEQRRLSRLMQDTGARFFFYGHDHVFAYQPWENLHYVCCGRPTWLSSEWWNTPGWREAYGRHDTRDPHDFYAALGYTRLTIGPSALRIEFIRTATDPKRMENVQTPLGGIVHACEIPYA